MLAGTSIINVFMFCVVGYYTIGTTTLKDKFSVVEKRPSTAASRPDTGNLQPV